MFEPGAGDAQGGGGAATYVRMDLGSLGAWDVPAQLAAMLPPLPTA